MFTAAVLSWITRLVGFVAVVSSRHRIVFCLVFPVLWTFPKFTEQLVWRKLSVQTSWSQDITAFSHLLSCFLSCSLRCRPSSTPTPQTNIVFVEPDQSPIACSELFVYCYNFNSWVTEELSYEVDWLTFVGYRSGLWSSSAFIVTVEDGLKRKKNVGFWLKHSTENGSRFGYFHKDQTFIYGFLSVNWC